MTSPAAMPITPIPKSSKRERLDAIDAVRGLAIVLMVLDHTRDYFSNVRFDATDLAKTNAALFFTRWVTHFCAPSFVFLAGTSAYLVGQRRSRAALRSFLLKRGLWLVLLEFTLVNFAWNFNLGYETGLMLMVIWALGMSMCALAILTFLSDRGVLALGALVIVGHHLLDGVAPSQWGAWAPLWSVLHVPGRIPGGFVLYPLIPWVGVMAVGFVSGRLYLGAAAQRQRTLLVLAATCALSFIVLRGLNIYGDREPWTPQERSWFDVLSFLNVSKYPPSLDYLLVMFSPMFMALWAAERARPHAAGWLLVFGRVPLFAYIVHLFMVHGLAGIAAWLTGYGTVPLTHVFTAFPEDWGVGLPGVYLVWLVVLALLYPACARFARYKAEHESWWLSYM